VRAHHLPLRVLGALLARAALYVGNDSGVTHLAAAWGAPTLALFGPTDPAQWAPLGPRVRTLRAPDGRMPSLGVASVLEAARARLT
jgi:ADP-heptose:LPS heptosyltransferase